VSESRVAVSEHHEPCLRDLRTRLLDAALYKRVPTGVNRDSQDAPAERV